VDGSRSATSRDKLFSTQIPLNAISSMELITGVRTPNSAIRPACGECYTRSDWPEAHGKLRGALRSFGQASEEASAAFGTRGWETRCVQTWRAPDASSTHPNSCDHAVGNNGTFFDRVDYQPNGKMRFT